MTIGEDRVRIKFNPSENSIVSDIKQATAHLIDACEALAREGMDHADGDNMRHCARLAQDAYELAAMWAVKAATAGK